MQMQIIHPSQKASRFEVTKIYEAIGFEAGAPVVSAYCQVADVRYGLTTSSWPVPFDGWYWSEDPLEPWPGVVAEVKTCPDFNPDKGCLIVDDGVLTRCVEHDIWLIFVTKYKVYVGSPRAVLSAWTYFRRKVYGGVVKVVAHVDQWIAHGFVAVDTPFWPSGLQGLK